MNAQILFHPQLKLTEAYRLAREQGGMLVCSMGRVRIRDCDAAPVHLRAAEIKRNVPEVAPCAA